MKIVKYISYAVLLALPAFSAGTAHCAGGTSGILLRQDTFAQSTGLGEAFTAYPGSMADIYYNPAGLCALKKTEVDFSYSNRLLGTQLGFAGFGYAFKNSALAVGYSYLDTGVEQFNFTDGTSMPLTALNEGLASLSYGVMIVKGFALGATIKQFSSALAQEYAANTITADAGIMVYTAQPGFAFGASVRNASGGLTYAKQSEILPQQTRAGVSYMFKIDNDPDFVAVEHFEKTVRLLADSVQDAEEGNTNSLGVESTFGYGSLRLGYKTGGNISGLYAGFGLISDSGVNLDYAFSQGAELGNAHSLTLKIRW